MADCQSGLGKCTFGDGTVYAGEKPGEGLTRETYVANYQRASGDSPNCTSSLQRMSLLWLQETGTTDTVGVSFTVSGGVPDVYQVSVTAKYEHQELSTKIEGTQSNIDIPPGFSGWVERGQLMNRYTGMWRTHYDDPKWGHYFWSVPDTITSPAKDGTGGLYSGTKWRTRQLPRPELASVCPRWYFPPGVIESGTTLRAGWTHQSNLTRLVMQSDGNLVMYRLRDNKAIWASGTWGHPGAYAKMQTDGNFVIYDAANRFLWHTNTGNLYQGQNAWAVMQDDGNFVVYKTFGGPGRGGSLWASGTTAAAK